MSSYAVIDFETANGDITSVCQIGVVVVENGVITKEWSTLVKPIGEFSIWNIKIHGITAEHVKDAPSFLFVYDELISLIKNKIVVSHGAFDKSVLKKIHQLHGLDPELNITWLDATRVVRNVLPQYSSNGYGLQNIAKHFSIKTNPHDALDDAKTCAMILNNLLHQSNTSIEEWVKLSKKTIKRDANREKVTIETQCNQLGWSIETIVAVREAKRKWSNGLNLSGATPEEIVVEYLAKEKTIVSWCEGISVMLFLKACALDFFEKNHWLEEFSTRDDAVRDSIFRQLDFIVHRIDELVAHATSITKEKLICNINEICNDEVVQHIHPNLSRQLMLALVDIMPIKQRANLLRALSNDPEFSNGWPDLTIVHNNSLSFVEVKTTDNLKDSQINFAKNIAIPNDLICSVVKVISGATNAPTTSSINTKSQSFFVALVKKLRQLF